MCADDPKTRSADGQYFGRFWYCVGGQIEPSESVQDAAWRETFEEVGISKGNVKLGPIVWFGEYDMILHDVPTHCVQTFIVAKTKQKNVFLNNLDDWEQAHIRNVEWFSLERITNGGEVIYPVVLPEYLPDIINEKYPSKPFEIDLAKAPKR